MEDYEAILLVKHEVFVFKIPPRTSNRGFRLVNFSHAFTDSFMNSFYKVDEVFSHEYSLLIFEVKLGISDSHTQKVAAISN